MIGPTNDRLAARQAYFRAMNRAGSRPRLVAIAGAALLIMATTAGACRGSDRSGSSTTTSIDANDPGTTTATATPVRVFSDPAQPIVVAIGEQFAIVLPAEPGAGTNWRPVISPDPKVILSIGTEFKEPGDAVTGQTQPDGTLSQVMRYGARTLGAAQIALRYGQPQAARSADPTLTFTVNVIDPNAPTTTVPLPTDTGTTTAPPSPTTSTRPRTTTTTRKTTTTA
jgi:predicted secreted protein